MTADTIQNYFLRAGASFRNSNDWSKEFMDDKGKSKVVRAGRFGIGVFAIFLLGLSFRLWTRHVTDKKSMGYSIDAKDNAQLIEIHNVENLPIGTTVEVELSNDSVYLFNNLPEKVDWFCWDKPKIVKRIIRNKKIKILKQKYILPLSKNNLPTEWSVIYPRGFERVYWTFGDAPSLSCNGISINEPDNFGITDLNLPNGFAFQQPRIAVFDNSTNLPVTIQRYGLSKGLPFYSELNRDITLSFIAHTLVCCPNSRKEAELLRKSYPLKEERREKYEGLLMQNKNRKLSLLTTATGITILEPWLFSLLNTNTFFIYGLYSSNFNYNFTLDNVLNTELSQHACCRLSFKSDNSSISIPEFLDFTLLHYSFPRNSYHIMVSSKNTKLSTYYNDNIKYINRPSSLRKLCEFQEESYSSSISLQTVIESVESELTDDDAFYVAEIHTNMKKVKPTSELAKVWNECLGPRIIPFDSTEREALIEDACKHQDLKRHIDAWRTMKQKGSKWAQNKYYGGDR